MRHLLMALGLLFGLALPARAASEAAIYVDASNGADANPGTADQPVQSLEQAQARVRAWFQQPGDCADVTVYIREHVYNLAKPWRFGPQDASPDSCVAHYRPYPGESVAFTSRTQIKGWTKAAFGERIYYAAAPARPRRLTLGDGRRIDMTAFGATAPTLKIKSWNHAGKTIEMVSSAGFDVAHPEYLEVVIPMGWSQFRGRVASVRKSREGGVTVAFKDPESAILFCTSRDMQLPCPRVANLAFGIGPYAIPGQHAVVYNAVESLSAPGFYYDDTYNLIYVFAPDGIDSLDALEAAEVYSDGATPTLLDIAGKPDGTQPVRGLSFEDFTYFATSWMRPGRHGFNGYNAAGLYTDFSPNKGGAVYSLEQIPAAIEIAYAKTITIRDSWFQDIGAAGVMWRCGAHNTLIDGNAFVHVDGPAVTASCPAKTAANTAPADRMGPATVSDNVFRDIGMAYSSAAVALSSSRHAKVVNNDFQHIAYSAVMNGFGGQFVATVQCCAFIAYNKIDHAMALNQDGAAIYSAGQQCGVAYPDTPPEPRIPGPCATFAYNDIMNVHPSGWDAQSGFTAAIYNDLGSQGNVTVHNRITNVETAFVMNCEKFDLFANNRVTNVTHAETVQYSGCNVAAWSADGTLKYSFHKPPENGGDMLHFERGGVDRAGDRTAPFRQSFPFESADAVFAPAGGYDSLSRREANTADAPFDAAKVGLSAARRAKYAELLR